VAPLASRALPALRRSFTVTAPRVEGGGTAAPYIAKALRWLPHDVMPGEQREIWRLIVVP
jgi:hypothetical protein